MHTLVRKDTQGTWGRVNWVRRKLMLFAITQGLKSPLMTNENKVEEWCRHGYRMQICTSHGMLEEKRGEKKDDTKIDAKYMPNYDLSVKETRTECIYIWILVYISEGKNKTNCKEGQR